MTWQRRYSGKLWEGVFALQSHADGRPRTGFQSAPILAQLGVIKDSRKGEGRERGGRGEGERRERGGRGDGEVEKGYFGLLLFSP